MIYPCIKSNTNTLDKLKNKNYYVYNLKEDIFDKSITSLKISETKKLNKKLKLPKISTRSIITLQKNLENNFTFNNTHILENIIRLN